MHNTGLLTLIALLATATTAARGEYLPVWSEEFDGANLDAETWTCPTHHGVARSAADAGFYTARAANVRVQNGQLRITAHKETYELAAYTSARLHTYDKHAFTHGRFSVRMKAPAVSGLRPQVSLRPVDLAYGSWPASGGIDIVDIVDGTACAGLHFGGSGPRGTHVRLPMTDSEDTRPDDGFHVYTGEWQPYEIRWFLDGTLVAVQHRWESAAAPYPAPFDQPFYLLIGLAVERPDAQALEDWPYTMEIDWLRVEQAEGNRPPKVKLAQPRPHAQIPAGDAVSLRAEASDPDDDLVGVEFYNGTERLVLDRQPPFAFDWAAPDGCYTVTARAVDAAGFARAASAEITVGRGCPPTPFGGEPATIPGRIEAENFDESPRNEGYHDTDASNNGGAYRLDEGVDIQPCSDGGFNLAWMINDEWTRYTVTVAQADRYDVRCRVASPNDTARIRLEIDGANITGSLAIPNTGDWQTFTDIVVRGVHLSAGEHVLRMVVEHHGLNLDYMEFIPSRPE